MRRLVALILAGIALIVLPTIALAASICDTEPGVKFEGFAVVTAYKYLPNGGVDYAPDYEINPSLTGPDGVFFSSLPVGYPETTGTYTSRKILYHVDCAIGQDTVSIAANLEIEDHVTVFVEYFFEGRPIFTQGVTMRPGTTGQFSAAHGLALSF